MSLPFAITLDAQTAFPLITPHGIDIAAMWLPMTKIQVEYFLSETDDSRFDAEWYGYCLAVNPRRSAATIDLMSFWQVFLTGIMFDEVQIMRHWWRECDLPMQTEWNDLLHTLDQYPAEPAYVRAVCDTPGLNQRAKRLIERLEQLHQDKPNRTLADQILMRGGIEEYVYADPGHQACWLEGYLPRQLRGGRRSELRNLEQGAAVESIGFRLVQRN